MCGIAGYVDYQRAPDEKILRAMEQTLAHRGPDEGRIWLNDLCGLAHRRLRIIDLSPAASQPMSDESGQLQVVFNGEIYNFRELRQELEHLGHRFRSRSDTEVIVHGYKTWGGKVFERLRGMFAIAIWDSRQQELTLARDRLGKKPLFYTSGASRLIFASELPAFKCLPNLKLEICRPAFQEYMEFGYVNSPRTILDGVRQLSAGHFATWNRSGFKCERFYSLPTQPPSARIEGSVSQAADALESPFREAVRRRLEADVPLGCFLSGGIDSSLVAAFAQEILGGKLETYSIGFENSEMNEAPHAARIAAHLATRHHTIMLSQESLLREFETILASASEPIGDDSFVPTYSISRATRQHVTVALSGDGGDELFAGYNKYRQFVAARRLQRWFPRPKLFSRLPVGNRFQKSMEALSAPDARSLARWLSSLWKRDELPELFSAGISIENAPDEFDREWDARASFPELERWQLTDMATYLQGDILTKVDRASMSVGLETRSPFLDHQFIEEVLRWPCHADPIRGGKKILKTLLAQRVPTELFERPKRGFGMPIEHWFRGALRPMVERYTEPGRIQRRGLLNSETISQTVRLHMEKKRNSARKLYSVLAFEIWADQFFGPDAALA